MPVVTVPDLGLPAIFILQALTNPDRAWFLSDALYAQAVAAANSLVATHEDRIYADCDVPPDPVFPYLVYQDTTKDRYTVESPSTHILSSRATCLIRQINQFMGGRASYNPTRALWSNLVECLTGYENAPVTAQSGVIGTITQSRWTNDHKTSYTDTDNSAKITEVGIEIEITHGP